MYYTFSHVGIYCPTNDTPIDQHIKRGQARTERLRVSASVEWGCTSYVSCSEGRCGRLGVERRDVQAKTVQVGVDDHGVVEFVTKRGGEGRRRTWGVHVVL